MSTAQTGTLDAIVEAWLDHICIERGHSDNTRTAYARDAAQFLLHLKSRLGRPAVLADLRQIDGRTFRGFMAARRKQGASSRSLARTLSALRAFFRWLEAEEILRNRAIMQVSSPKHLVSLTATPPQPNATPCGSWVREARNACCQCCPWPSRR
jgi:integrase/recombinase XerC